MEPSEILLLIVGAFVLMVFDPSDSGDDEDSEKESDEDEEN
jgi:hypothetical protein